MPVQERGGHGRGHGLAVHMPAQSFEPGEAPQAIVAFLQGSAIEWKPALRFPGSSAKQARRGNLRDGRGTCSVNAGFGCVNCHVLAGKIPPGGEPGDPGPRPCPGSATRMTEPLFRALDRQSAADHRRDAHAPVPPAGRDRPGHSRRNSSLPRSGSCSGAPVSPRPPRRGPARSSSARATGPGWSATWSFCPVRPDTEYTPRGLAIGFKNGHSLLFDTDQLAWLASWHLTDSCRGPSRAGSGSGIPKGIASGSPPAAYRPSSSLTTTRSVTLPDAKFATGSDTSTSSISAAPTSRLRLRTEPAANGRRPPDRGRGNGPANGRRLGAHGAC